MGSAARSTLLVHTVIAAGVTSGAFLVFSNFVMASLGKLAPAAVARAMQQVNRSAPDPLFTSVRLRASGSGVLGHCFVGNSGDGRSAGSDPQGQERR